MISLLSRSVEEFSMFLIKFTKWCCNTGTCIQLFQLRLSPEQSGKVEYERERLLGIANKLMNFQSDSQAAFRARIRLFRFARGQP
jgi:hypothetical protein